MKTETKTKPKAANRKQNSSTSRRPRPRPTLARRAQFTAQELGLMTKAASSALVQQAMKITTTKNVSPKSIAAAAKWLSVLQQQELRQREIALAEERLQFEREKIQL